MTNQTSEMKSLGYSVTLIASIVLLAAAFQFFSAKFVIRDFVDLSNDFLIASSLLGYSPLPLYEFLVSPQYLPHYNS